MDTFESRLHSLAVRIPEILIPAPGVDLRKWAVIACDQYTSEHTYWEKVESYVGSEPSTLKMIYPEVYLESDDRADRITAVKTTMERYIADGTVEPAPYGLKVVRRTFESGKIRSGLLLALDLDAYDYAPGSQSLIRATEGTIVERIPPRLEVREGAALESPHILVLINDPGLNVVEPLVNLTSPDNLLYHTELMFGAGSLSGYNIDDGAAIRQFVDALENLPPKETKDRFLFAMGDGNHSFATAKAYWNSVREHLTEHEKERHPARYGLVEVVNLFDAGLDFHSIHRVLFGADAVALSDFLQDHFDDIVTANPDDIVNLFDDRPEEAADTVLCGYRSGNRSLLVKKRAEDSGLAAERIQTLIDAFLAEHPGVSIDYVHGARSAARLAENADTAAVFVPVLKKESLFPTVSHDGILPQKAFSLGESDDKRFYFECRKIR